jgi:hypothetical protein
VRLRGTDETGTERTSNQQTTELFHFRSPRRFACWPIPTAHERRYELNLSKNTVGRRSHLLQIASSLTSTRI